MRIKGLDSDSDSLVCLGIRLAVRSPSEIVTSVAVREHEPGVRDRARLQNGVWLQFLNSSFFHEKTEEERRRRSMKRSVWLLIL